MARRQRETWRVQSGATLHQTVLERRLCNAICLCQLVSIISGVALVYLCFTVIKPSHLTLSAEFEDAPAVCTTLRSEVSTLCPRPSCAEWCISKSGSSCRVISAAVRRPGANVTLRNCRLEADFCSEQAADALQTFTCSEGENGGECHNLEHFFNCSETIVTRRAGAGYKTVATSRCRNITALFECTSRPAGVDPAPAPLHRCNRYVCNNLSGVYECRTGACRLLVEPHCRPRCANLSMGNVVVATADLFHWGRCEMAKVDGRREWSARRPLALFCTRLRVVSAAELHGEDCLNGTQLEPAEFARLRSYREVRDALRRRPQPLPAALVPGEESLRVFNRSQVMINIVGCVNTLREECTGWLAERDVDGRDGRFPAVYPCHVTPHASDYVITDYDRHQTVYQMVLAATLPASLMMLSCFCLCLCGKLVAVNEFGVFFCRYCHDEEDAVRAAAGSEIL